MSKETPEEAVAHIAAERGSAGKPQVVPKRKAAFLTAFAAGGIVTQAAQAAGVPRRTAYNWYADDGDFAAAWDDAKEEATDAMEAEALRRGVEGITKPVFQGGRRVGDIREYSDTLLVIMLKANRPAKYRERYEVSGPNGGPITHADLKDCTDVDLIAEVEAIARRAASLGRGATEGA